MLGFTLSLILHRYVELIDTHLLTAASTMANNQNLFFYAPTWDYPPDGPIKLGNVITSVKKPERPLHWVPPTDSDIFSTKKMSVEHTKDQLRSDRFSILIRFFSIFGLNVQVSTGRETR